MSLSVIENIQAQRSSLSPTERKAADYVLKHTFQVVDFTVKDLAMASDVSEATVIRMCQHLGYKGYWPFRISLSKELVKYQDQRNVSEGNSVGDIFREYSRTMLNLAENVDQEVVYEAVALLRRCEQVHLIAAGNTTPLIEHMAFRLGRLGVKCSFSGIAEYFMNQINLAGQDDVVLAISQSGMTKSIIDGAVLAKQRNLKVIVITAYKNSALAELADYVVEAKGDFTRFDFYKKYNHLCEMAVAEMLLDVLEKDEKTQTIIQEKDTVGLEILSDMKL